MRASLFALVFTAAVSLAEPTEVAVMPAKIVPEQVSVLSAEAGVMCELADASQHQERGAVIAVLNKERTEQDREEMELQIARDSLAVKDEIRKLEAQRSKVQFYLSLSEKERSFARDMAPTGADDAPINADSLKDIDERLGLQRRQLESAPRIKRNEFKRSHDKLTLRMPFAGRLQYNASLPEDGGAAPFDYVPAPGQAFATVCDDSAFYITINVSRAELTQLPPERFSVYVSLPEGKRLVGTFDKRRVERANGGADMLVYFFRVAKEDHETAYTMLGSHAQAHLVYDAGEGTLLVRKSELITKPEAAACADWEELISRLYPQHVIVLTGERDILLRPRE